MPRAPPVINPPRLRSAILFSSPEVHRTSRPANYIPAARTPSTANLLSSSGAHSLDAVGNPSSTSLSTLDFPSPHPRDNHRHIIRLLRCSRPILHRLHHPQRNSPRR